VLLTLHGLQPDRRNLDRRRRATPGLLQATARAGFPLRVALIDSPSDLGTVTQLWREPLPYAEYLGEELSLDFAGRCSS